MRGASAAIAIALGVLLATSTAQAQSGPGGPTFLALDVAGGIVPLHNEEAQKEDPWGIAGWSIDATVRFMPWLGVTGEYVRSSPDDLPASHYLGGVRASSAFFGNSWPARAYGHVLVGAAVPRELHEGPGTGVEVVLGGGFDLLMLRVQFDYVWSAVEDVRSFRAMVGGVVPLCFRRCGTNDGFNLERFAQRTR